MSEIIILFFSFIFLLWSANHLVTGASGMANYYQISPLMIGLTVVAFGTSAPEMIVSIQAALSGYSHLSIGNAIGSNIANIGLVLGIVTLIRPPTIQISLLRREYPILFFIMILTYFIMMDGYLGIVDGCLLLLGTFILLTYLAVIAQKSAKSYVYDEFKEAIQASRSFHYNMLSIFIGLIVLPISAHCLVDSAVAIAKWLGISETVIGLSVIAIGTSVPELVTSLVAAIKEESDIAIGNILGSNMFNLITVLCFPALINPAPVSKDILSRDIPMMFVVTLIIFLINYHYKHKMYRWNGALLLLLYVLYIVSIF